MRAECLFIIVMMLLLPTRARATDLIAENGVLVLPSNLHEGGMFNIKGTWQFHPSEILPISPDCAAAGGQHLDIMAYWNARILAVNPAWNGTSSFCLRIENPGRERLSLWWPERNTVDIYANGRLVFGRGQLKGGLFKATRERQTGILDLPTDATIILWVHANNEFMRWRKIRGDLYLGQTQSLARTKERDLIIMVFMITTLLTTGFYQFSLYLIHRDRRETFFLGVFCVALAARYAGIGNSNLFSMLAPDLLGGRGYGVGHVGYFISAACFYHFLQITYPDLIRRRLLKILWAVALVFSVLVMTVGDKTYALTLLMFHPIGGISMVSGVYAVFRAILQRREGCIVLAHGTFVLAVTAWADMIRSQGYGLGFDIFPIGQLAFVTAASLLVSIRFSHAFHILSHLSHELSKIVPLHVIPLLRSGTELERCMPIGEHEAVVLVFDVVGSTRVTHPGFRKALDLCMDRFFEAINHGYHPEKLEATGYRIKEMGDGVICAIGFPFQVPGGRPLDVEALRLAERFCAIFHEEMSRLETAEPIYCGIGLARGRVEGFFPKSGQKQYDLRGYPLTLATRYEAMRNPVFRKFGRQGSVIFIHDGIFQNLDASAQSAFQRWDTTIPGQQIRDDENARQAWFRFVPYEKTSPQDQVAGF